MQEVTAPCFITVHSRHHAEHAEAGKLSVLIYYVFSSIFIFYLTEGFF